MDTNTTGNPNRQGNSHDENSLISQRRLKLKDLRKNGNAYPNDFRREDFNLDIAEEYTKVTKEDLEKNRVNVSVAGRIMLSRTMGRAAFIHIQDMTGRLQVYIKEDTLGEDIFNEFKKWDIGDIVGVNGYLFKTNTQELTVHATSVRILTKSLIPLPEKFHGLTSKEICYRQRYVDLIANNRSREVFIARNNIIQSIRDFLTERRFLEVETPILHTVVGGAAARPFTTHHNFLDMDMYLRIAPELFLKRLVVGGFERVFEINRNFRNEGVSPFHNPEFTMLEFYQAYATYHDLIDITEEMFKYVVKRVTGGYVVDFQDMQFDFSKPFEKLTLKNSILKYNKSIKKEDLENIDSIRSIAKQLNIEFNNTDGIGKIQTSIFEEIVEDRLIQPTFITEYPIEVSPLARRNDLNPEIADRFELFIAKCEVANAFSELNDPEDQADRFMQQLREKDLGDEEAMDNDTDYVKAISYGLPPTAGEGIGIDRLTMLLTNSPSIRDVILFPHLKAK